MRSGKYFITINEHDDFTIFQTENKVLFEALSCAGDKGKMKAAMKNHPEWYQNLDKDSAAAISGIAGIKGYRYYEVEDAYFYKSEYTLKNILEQIDDTKDKQLLKEKWIRK